MPDSIPGGPRDGTGEGLGLGLHLVGLWCGGMDGVQGLIIACAPINFVPSPAPHFRQGLIIVNVKFTEDLPSCRER